MDPFGFFGKFQGIKVKGKAPFQVAEDIVNLLLKKPKYREQLLQGMGRSFTGLPSPTKLKAIQTLNSWNLITDDQMRALLEQSSLSDYEKAQSKDLIGRVGAFKTSIKAPDPDDDVPF